MYLGDSRIAQSYSTLTRKESVGSGCFVCLFVVLVWFGLVWFSNVQPELELNLFAVFLMIQSRMLGKVQQDIRK